MKKVGYFMCLECYEIHKIELNIKINNLRSGSNVCYNEVRSIGNYLRCGKIKKSAISKEESLKRYNKMKQAAEKAGLKVCAYKPGCKGKLVEIDEKMLYAVRTLNIKGYFTEFCCQGHYNGDFANLIFEPYLHDMMMNISPPYGWYYNYNNKLYFPNNRPILHYKITDIASNEHIYNLNKWVYDLPNLNN